jgi:inner membrane protein
VDNLCHTLVGGALAKAGLERATPRATAALVLGANLPDADILWVEFLGPGGYLAHHRGITHSWVGILLQVPLLVAGLYLYSRWRDPESRRAGPCGLALASVVGLVSHLCLDWTNPYGVRPWLPFSDRWVYGDWVAIVDPWLWLVPGVALYWATGTTRARRSGWAALAAAASAVVLFSGRAPVWMRVVWFLGLGGAVAAPRVSRRVRAWASDATRSVRAALLAVLVYEAAAALAHARAVRAARAWRPDVAGAVRAAIPTPGQPGRWRLVVYGPDQVRIAEWRWPPGSVVGADSAALNLDDPAVRAALATDRGRAWRVFARFPFAEVEPAGSAARVILRDARYAFRERAGFAVAAILVPAPEADRARSSPRGIERPD